MLGSPTRQQLILLQPLPVLPLPQFPSSSFAYEVCLSSSSAVACFVRPAFYGLLIYCSCKLCALLLHLSLAPRFPAVASCRSCSYGCCRPPLDRRRRWSSSSSLRHPFWQKCCAFLSASVPMRPLRCSLSSRGIFEIINGVAENLLTSRCWHCFTWVPSGGGCRRRNRGRQCWAWHCFTWVSRGGLQTAHKGGGSTREGTVSHGCHVGGCRRRTRGRQY